MRKKWIGRLSEKHKARIRELERKGYSEVEIASELGVTLNTLRVYRSRYNLKRSVEETSPWEDLATRISKIIVPKKNRSTPIHEEMTDRQILYFSKHPVQFLTQYIVFQGKRLRLYPYQRDWITDTSKKKIAVKSRRVGLSFASCLRAFHISLFNPSRVSLFVSTKEDRAKELLDYIYYFAESNKIFRDIFMEQTQTYCRFTNDSRIYSLTCSPSGARGIPQGMGIDIYLDELAHYQKPLDERMYQALLPNLALGGTITIWSTPFGKQGLFWKIFRDAERLGFTKYIITWDKCPMFTKESMEEIRQSLGIDDFTYRQEFCCEFIDEGHSLFPVELVQSAVSEIPKEINGKITLGIDFALKHDSTVVTVVERISEMYYVKEIREIKGRGVNFIVPAICEMIDRYKPLRVKTDATGMGLPLTDALNSIYGSIIEGISFTNMKKDALIMNLWRLFNDLKIRIPDNRTLKNQLVRLERKETPTGLPKYEHPKGGRDDYVWSLALACDTTARGWTGMVDLGIEGEFENVSIG